MNLRRLYLTRPDSFSGFYVGHFDPSIATHYPLYPYKGWLNKPVHEVLAYYRSIVWPILYPSPHYRRQIRKWREG